MGDPYSRRQKMNTNLEHYRIFYYAGKYGSITQAAEELSISQPAVSQALKQLEHTLGTGPSSARPRACVSRRRERCSIPTWPGGMSTYRTGKRS